MLKKENLYKIFFNFCNNFVMFYKNFLDRELVGVMCVCCWFDYIVVVMFVFKGQLVNVKVVVCVCCEFKLLCDSFWDVRVENFRKIFLYFIFEWIKSSILV